MRLGTTFLLVAFSAGIASAADESPTTSDDVKIVDIVAAMTAASIFDPAKPDAGTFAMATLSACEIYSANLNQAQCRIERDGADVGSVSIQYGYQDAQNGFVDTLSAEKRTKIISECGRYGQTKCWAVIKGIPFRTVNSLNQIAFGVTAHDFEFVTDPKS